MISFINFELSIIQILILIQRLLTNLSGITLTTYVTNKYNGKMFIIEGQQRLITLILRLRLYQIAKDFNLEERSD